MNLPKVSLIISAYNAEKYIRNTIESILLQQFDDFELIIVDDGSNDSTFKVVSDLAEDARIKLFMKGNSGQSDSLNFGYKQSSGCFVKFMDADDLISPNMLSEQVKLIETQPNSIISSDWGRFYGNNLSTFNLEIENQSMIEKPIDWILNSFIEGRNMMQCARFLIPRNLIEVSGLWNERLTLNNDTEFFTRLFLKADSIIRSKGTILYYRSGLVNNVSSIYTEKSIDSLIKSVILTTKYILHVNSSAKSKQICANILQNAAFTIFEHYPKGINSIEEEIRQLGGSSLKLGGGKVKKFLIFLFGWKNLIRLQKILKKSIKFNNQK
jgi:glycosyltransferase involved in cell wall biosynthesis